MRKKISNILNIILITIIPLLDIFNKIIPIELNIAISLMLLLISSILTKGYAYKLLVFFYLAVIVLSTIYLDNSIKISLITYIKAFSFPIMLMYFKGQENTNIPPDTLSRIFYLYLLIILITNNTSLIGVLIVLLPLAINRIYKHNNKYLSGIYTLLLVISLIIINNYLVNITFVITMLYQLIKNRKDIKKSMIVLLIISIGLLTYSLIINIDSINIIDNLNKQIDIFNKTNFEEQLLGIYNLKDYKINNLGIDAFDIFFSLGYLGTITFVVTLLISFRKLKAPTYFYISFTSLFLYSFISHDFITSLSTTVLLGLTSFVLKEEDKKRILLVSNMYPSKNYRHYGVFVKNVKKSLEESSFIVEKVSIIKHDNKIIKLLAYLRMYGISFLKAMFNSYDYIYCHFISHTVFPIIPGYYLSSNTKLVLNVHGNDIVKDNEEDEKNIPRSKKVIKYADKVIVPSEYYLSIVNEEYNVDKKKIVVYPSGGVNKEIFKDIPMPVAKEYLKLDPNINYIGMVSRIEKDKGWDTLVNAASYLSKENLINNYKFIIIGKGKETQDLKKLIKQKELKDYFIIKEFANQETLNYYYNSFDMLIFPTKRKSESLGLVGLEAMATKTPLIACSLYGPREYAINNINALTYEKDEDGKKLASLIKKMIEMPKDKKDELIENAYETSSNYDERRTTVRLKQVFKN